jgi:CRP-like cAMP-binding protein
MARVCPDCPSVRSQVLEALVHRDAGCAFRCLSVPARQPLPARWRAEYGFALVRRGIVVRQRVDGNGRATSIDIAGPGSALPLGEQVDDTAAGYAVDDVMLCLVPSDQLDEAVGAGDTGARDVVGAQAKILQRVERIAEARSRTAATSRVAALLLAIGDTLSPSRPLSVIPSAIQQRDLAALLALRHESVCRAVASLEKKGFVQRSGNGLRLVDRSGLESV